MTDFVIQQWSIELTIEQRDRIKKYADFLKQPLNLGMFVPCDLDGNVLSRPPLYIDYKNEEGGNKELFQFNLELYNESKERVLFKGFYLISEEDCSHNIVSNGKTRLVIRKNSKLKVEWIVFKNIELTKSAIKQIGV